MMNKFTKADLRTGYYVQLANLDFCIYIEGFFINERFVYPLKLYNDNLFFAGDNRDLDVYKVFRNNEIHSISNIVEDRNELLFERERKDIVGRNYEKLHRQMWSDIAEGKVDSKKEWLDKYYPPVMKMPYSGCFACEEARRRSGEDDCCYCGCCPITPVEEDLCCGGLFQEYNRLREEGNLREAAYYAGLIRDLPWK